MTETKDTQTPPPAKKSLMQQFIDFLQTFGVIGLAIAFVIGAAASTLVTGLVNDIVNPLIGIVLPSGNLANATVTVPSIYAGKSSVFLNRGSHLENNQFPDHRVHCLSCLQAALEGRPRRRQDKEILGRKKAKLDLGVTPIR